jgi:hypothetical protein
MGLWAPLVVLRVLDVVLSWLGVAILVFGLIFVGAMLWPDVTRWLRR